MYRCGAKIYKTLQDKIKLKKTRSAEAKKFEICLLAHWSAVIPLKGTIDVELPANVIWVDKSPSAHSRLIAVAASAFSWPWPPLFVSTTTVLDPPLNVIITKSFWPPVVTQPLSRNKLTDWPLWKRQVCAVELHVWGLRPKILVWSPEGIAILQLSDGAAHKNQFLKFKWKLNL